MNLGIPGELLSLSLKSCKRWKRSLSWHVYHSVGDRSRTSLEVFAPYILLQGCVCQVGTERLPIPHVSILKSTFGFIGKFRLSGASRCCPKYPRILCSPSPCPAPSLLPTHQRCSVLLRTFAPVFLPFTPQSSVSPTLCPCSLVPVLLSLGY